MSILGPLQNWVAGGLIYLVYLVIKFRRRAIGTKERNDPSFHEEAGFPLLGKLPTLIKNRARTLEEGTITALQHGPGFSFTVPGLRIIDVSKPEWLEYIQKTNFNNYVKGPMFQTIMLDVLGHGIFVADGAVWKRTRHATSTIFHVNSFKSIMIPSIDRGMDELIQLLKLAANEERSIDFCDLFLRFTLDSFVHMTFGKELGIISSEHESKASIDNRAPSFSEAFDVAQNQLDFRFAIPVGWELLEAINFSMKRSMNSSCRILDNHAYSLIDERVSELSHESDIKHNEKPRKDLLDLFIIARDERGGGLDRTELRDTAMNLIIAGRDTTAQALSWAFFHILMNKDLISKIRNETIDILGEAGDDQERVTYDNYKQFIWCHAIILETLRLHPSVPKNAKTALANDKIPGGPTIEAGNLVRWSDWQMGRDPNIWGPDCGEFKPDRWIDENGTVKNFGQFKFHAFNGGPRICLGINLAIFESIKVIVEVFNTFNLEFAPGWWESVPKSEALEGISSKYPTPMYKSSLTLPMGNPMMILVQHRQD